MKPIIQFLLFSLLIRLTFSLAQAQSTVYGTGAGMGGIYSTHIGTYAGRVSTGHENTFVGNSNGYSNNTFVGISCGSSNTTGSNNTFLGYSSGNNNTAGVGNVFIGHYAGFYETGSNKFYVANSTSNNPLLYGEFDNNSLSTIKNVMSDELQ